MSIASCAERSRACRQAVAEFPQLSTFNHQACCGHKGPADWPEASAVERQAPPPSHDRAESPLCLGKDWFVPQGDMTLQLFIK
jgi:predicted small lipoprotein YifL